MKSSTLADDSRLALFVELSERLTGVAPLGPSLAAVYLERIEKASFLPAMEALLEVFATLKKSSQPEETALRENIFGVPELRRAAQQLIVLWYSSALMENPDDPKTRLLFGKPDHHFQALLWPTIAAHPPALSGGYFGHWHYPPEN